MIGHSPQRAELSGLPFQAVLLEGPDGVGKWLAAEEAASSLPGAIVFTVREDATVAAVRDAISWLQTKPLQGAKVALFDLDAMETSSHHVILKILEEPPAHARIVCVSSGSVLATIRSRCHIIRFSLLRRDEVIEVLESLGKPESLAREMAKLSGSVTEVLRAEEMLASRMDVLTFLNVLERRDHGAIWDLDEVWTKEHSRLLWLWVLEASVGRPKIFKRADLELSRKLGKMVPKMAQRVRRGQFRPSDALGLWRL